MNRNFDMASYAQKHMAPAIEKFGLTLVRRGGDVAWLQNVHCTIRLENVDNDYVRFEFHRADNLEEIWEFADFLDCMYEWRGMQLRPLPPDDFDNEGKFVFMLEKYNELIVAGYFDAPLVGDFSWGAKYKEAQAEYKRLSTERFRLEEKGHPEAKAIQKKRLNGDPTWMDDVKRILAAQETNESQ
jgi:hypothetical protein